MVGGDVWAEKPALHVRNETGTTGLLLSWHSFIRMRQHELCVYVYM